MKYLFLCLSFCFTLMVSTQSAHAGRLPVYFGESQNVVKIIDLELKGPEDEELFLAHLVTKEFFIAGLYLKDDGYVLGIKGEHNSYYPLPEADKVTLLQEANLLPNPLPEYKIDLMDYATGYSLWLILVGLIGWVVIATKLEKKKTPPAV